MTMQYTEAEDATGVSQVEGDDSPPAEEEAEFDAKASYAELSSKLDAMQRGFQQQWDKRLRPLEQDHPTKLRALEEQQRQFGQWVLEIEDSVRPFVARYVEQLKADDPDAYQRALLDNQVRTQKQLTEALLREQTQKQAPPAQGDTFNARATELWNDACNDDDGIRSYASDANVPFETALNNFKGANRNEGETPAQYVRRLERLFRQHVDTIRNDREKARRPAVQAGQSRPAGGTATWDRATKIQKVSDLSDDEYFKLVGRSG